MLNIKIVTWALATTTLISFVVCVLFGLFTPDSLHSRALLEQLLPGYKPFHYTQLHLCSASR